VNKPLRHATKSFHEKAGQRQVFPFVFSSSCCFFFQIIPNEPSRLCRLPSALFVERWSLGASWVYSIQKVLLPDFRPLLPSLEGKLGQDLVAVA
jgi:hypothetical protein